MRYGREIEMEDMRRSRRMSKKSIFLWLVVAGCFGVFIFRYLLLRDGRPNVNIYEVGITQNVYHMDNDKNDFYSLIFDAGSTGTRVHVFHFRRNERGQVKLLTEIFQETKPGLSHYADQPIQGAETVEKLLRTATEGTIPEVRWPSTPLTLKATAGLRLLPGNKATGILSKVKNLFKRLTFRHTDDFVSILDGQTEGIYGWVTVNFLSGTLSLLDPNQLFGALDLGGGSTQVTFPLHTAPMENDWFVPDGYRLKLKLLSKDFSLYTHSYLGLGLMSARASILNSSMVHSSDSTVEQNMLNVLSPCFPSGFSSVWTHGPMDFQISGSDQCSFDSCREVAKKIVLNVNKPGPLSKRKFFAFSYFYDRAVDLGLIDSNSGGQVQIKDYIDIGQTVCQRGSVEHLPFLCLDTVFISTLLMDGYGFQQNQELTLKKKIDDVEVSWALGAALDLYEKTKKTT